MRWSRRPRRHRRALRARVAPAAVLAITALLALAPAGAAPASSFAVVPSASPAGPSNGTIYGVACPAASSCFAVGGYITTGGEVPLTERWDGTRWSLVPAPAGFGRFLGVSCPATTSCLAVGGTVGGSMTAKWDGTSWSAVPFPGGGTGNAGIVDLSSVACASVTSCFAVGWKGVQASTTFVLHWDGTAWSQVSSPNRDGEGQLQGVSCASPTFCVAVGNSSSDDTSTALVETWDGTAWTIVDLPALDPSSSTDLSAVSCSSESSCAAVGSVQSAAGVQPLVESWDGQSWSTASNPSAPGAVLLGVSCATNTSCFTVGTTGLIEQFDGTSWTISQRSFSGLAGDLRGVACTSSSDCFAVGDQGAGSAPQAVVERWDGARWSTVAGTPVEASTTNATLAAVSCPAAAGCFAVGSYTSAAGKVVTLVERPSGAAWVVVPSPNRAGVNESSLAGVSCASATSCFAVGRAGSGGAWQTLVERWNGRTWSIQASPNVSRAINGRTPNTLTSVSCVSATRCFAVGFTTYHSVRTLVERWDGTSWSVVPTPNRTTTGQNLLEAVSCSSATSCFAVGRTASTSTQNASTLFSTLVERWNGTAWSIVASPNAASAVGELAGVSCVTAQSCVAVGNAYRFSTRQSLVESWNGQAWTRVANADPAGVKHSALTAVSCLSAGACVAVGNDSGTGSANPSAAGQVLVKTLASGRWTITAAATPTGARDSAFTGVSCANASKCVAAGYLDTYPARSTLIEQRS